MPNNLTPFTYPVSVCSSFAVFHLVLVQDFFLHLPCNSLPTFIHIQLTHRPPTSHFLCVFHQNVSWLVLCFFCGPSSHLFSLALIIQPFYIERCAYALPTPVPFAWPPLARHLHPLSSVPKLLHLFILILFVPFQDLQFVRNSSFILHFVQLSFVWLAWRFQAH